MCNCWICFSAGCPCLPDDGLPAGCRHWLLGAPCAMLLPACRWRIQTNGWSASGVSCGAWCPTTAGRQAEHQRHYHAIHASNPWSNGAPFAALLVAVLNRSNVLRAVWLPARLVQEVQDDPREEWLCEYANWNVEEQPPHKPPCSSAAATAASSGGAGNPSGSGRRSGGKRR
jgi:hypothetical protein